MITIMIKGRDFLCIINLTLLLTSSSSPHGVSYFVPSFSFLVILLSNCIIFSGFSVLQVHVKLEHFQIMWKSRTTWFFSVNKLNITFSFNLFKMIFFLNETFNLSFVRLPLINIKLTTIYATPSYLLLKFVATIVVSSWNQYNICIINAVQNVAV